MIINRTIFISGKVQGVYFRESTRMQAELLGVKGEVMNTPDGKVIIIAEGEEHAVFDLINWCHHGPPRAKVSEVKTTKGDIRGFHDFRVIRF